MSNEPKPVISLEYRTPEKPVQGQAGLTVLVVIMAANIVSFIAVVGWWFVTDGRKLILPIHLISPFLSFVSLVASIPACQRKVKIMLMIPLLTGITCGFLGSFEKGTKTVLEAIKIGYFSYFLLAIPFTIVAFFAIRRLQRAY